MRRSVQYIQIIFVSLILVYTVSIAAVNADSYNKMLNCNQLDELKSALKSSNSTDHSLFYNEKLNIQVADTGNFSKIKQNSSDTELQEKALIEIVNLKFLQREYSHIINLLSETSCTNIDLLYWKSLSCYKTGKYSMAISEAEKIIKCDNDNGLAELSYILIANSYIKLGKYENAMSKLEELKNSQYISHIPVVHLKTAYCCIKLGKYNLAAGYLKKIIKDYPFSQYSIEAEEMYTGIIGKYDTAVAIKDPILNNTSHQEVKKINTAVAEAVAETASENCVYLQTGAFSARKNAERQLQSLKDMGYPGLLATKERTSGPLYLVRVGPFPDKSHAETIKKELDLKSIKSFYVN